MTKRQSRSNENIDYSDIFELKYTEEYEDKRFKISYLFTPILFLSMVYAGYATMTLRNGLVLTASNLDQVPKIGVMDLYEFKYLSRPAQMSMAELKKLFEVLDLNPVLLDNPNSRDDRVKQLLKAAQEVSNASVLAARKLQDGFELWGEPLASSPLIAKMQKACVAVRDEFSNYQAKYNTPAKLDELGPCDVATFKSKLNSIVDSYTKGKDTAKLRIVVKRTER